MWLGLPSLVMSKVGFTQLCIGCFQLQNCQGCLSDIVPSIAAAGRNRTVKKLSAHGEAIMAEGAVLDRGATSNRRPSRYKALPERSSEIVGPVKILLQVRGP